MGGYVSGWVVVHGNQSKGYASFHLEVDTGHGHNFSYISGIIVLWSVVFNLSAQPWVLCSNNGIQISVLNALFITFVAFTCNKITAVQCKV